MGEVGCEWKKPGVNSAIVRSPNVNNKGGNYYCRHGSDCTFDGDQFWDTLGDAVIG